MHDIQCFWLEVDIVVETLIQISDVANRLHRNFKILFYNCFDYSEYLSYLKLLLRAILHFYLISSQLKHYHENVGNHLPPVFIQNAFFN